MKDQKNERIRISLFVTYRPGLLKVLRDLKSNFELVLFTASDYDYAQIVTSSIKEFFSQILTRKKCYFSQDLVIKDLRYLLEGRKLENIVLIDNKPECFSF